MSGQKYTIKKNLIKNGLKSDILAIPKLENRRKYESFFGKKSYIVRGERNTMNYKGDARMKKRGSTICRDCGNEFRGQVGAYRCPSCKKKEMAYRAKRERMRQQLPFYLKTDS